MPSNSPDCVRRTLALLKEDLATPMPDTIQFSGLLRDNEGDTTYTDEPWADFYTVQAYQHVESTGAIVPVFTSEGITDKATADRVLKQVIAAFPYADVI